MSTLPSDAPVNLAHEIERRRSFAIISHPDAGKTTLTEKLLLYGGAIQLAGSVKARRNQKKATSDWMELEKQRGISVTSTVLQFEYEGYVLNLLDTPGHNDFSSDTYRTLTAADSAVMLIDNAKGVETQTRKLFAVCRQRGIPIFTFVNKMDHDGIGPLALLSEVEKALSIRSVPMNWPIGSGPDFRGIYDRATRMVHLYERTARNASKATLEVLSIDDPNLPQILGKAQYDLLLEEIELIDIAGEPVDRESIAGGELTPVFFGSALTNFGVEPFLQKFIELAPAPAPRVSKGTEITPEDPFSAYVFKIQANMNPEHRDRIAFIRVVSGCFEKDMDVWHARTKSKIRITRPQKLFAQDRETAQTAFPGDILGVPNTGVFQLGDTIAVDQKVEFDEVPLFAPETFATIINRDASRFKHFDKGIEQLSQEGLVDLFFEKNTGQRMPILGAVGQLQFDVVRFRLETEYGVKTEVMPIAQTIMAWLEASPAALAKLYIPHETKLLEHKSGRLALVSTSAHGLRYLAKTNSEIKLTTPSGAAPIFEDH